MSASHSSPVLYWFRTDLRLQDNPAWTHACAMQRPLVAVTVEPALSEREQAWGITGIGAARTAWWRANVQALQAALSAYGVTLHVLRGAVAPGLTALCAKAGIETVVCEDIAAPYERADVRALRACGLDVHSLWQSSLLEIDQLPFPVEALPGVFTPFRNRVEREGCAFRTPLTEPVPLASGVWSDVLEPQGGVSLAPESGESWVPDPRSAFQWHGPEAKDRDALNSARAGSAGGHAYLARYCASERMTNYKATRNGLVGMAYSSKWSPWLAVGALSAPELMTAVRKQEAVTGATDGSYWLWFELLWRDYFRFLHLQYGGRLYRPCGLQEAVLRGKPSHHHRSFVLWTEGRTGCDLVDAGMRELACTGYLSNRMRQMVASFLIHELACDWRAGAAWMESQLLDFDVYSNQGNWLYLAGFGTDPRGGRRFNIAKQVAEHDADGAYRALWSQA
jgi:deoxyribodipyrimidine photo-lyase